MLYPLAQTGSLIGQHTFSIFIYSELYDKPENSSNEDMYIMFYSWISHTAVLNCNDQGWYKKNNSEYESIKHQNCMVFL